MAEAAPCSDVTEVIIRFMPSWGSDMIGWDVALETEDEVPFWLEGEPSVVTLAILISESGSVLLRGPEDWEEEPPGSATEDDEESLCSESSSSSMTMGSVAVEGVLVAATAVEAVEEAGGLGVLEDGVDVGIATVAVAAPATAEPATAAGSEQSVLGVSVGVVGLVVVVAGATGAASPTSTTSSSLSSPPASLGAAAASSVAMETVPPSSSNGGAVSCCEEGVASIGSTPSPSSITTGLDSDSPSITKATTWQHKQRQGN